MNRTLSVIRRRPNLVDIMVPLVVGIPTYRFKWATNFDGAFATFLNSTNVGYRDPSIPEVSIETQPIGGKVRVVFNPATYGIFDDRPFWLELFHVSGGEVQISAATLILPSLSNHGVQVVTIHGAAPSAGSVAGSLQIDLPRMMYDMRIHNEDSTNSLFIATQELGPESEFEPHPVPVSFTFDSPLASLWVRGGGGVVNFSASFSHAFPK